MKILIISLLLIYTIEGYSREGAVRYARENVHNPNHDCKTGHEECTPYAYYGSEHCDYKSHGGNCANFVSQCLVKGGGHPILKGGGCRGYPCGFEEVGANELGECLKERGWKSKCGHLLEPPSYIKAGDVLIYHKNDCTGPAHAVLITEGGAYPKITCHSKEHLDQTYRYMSNEKPYYQWLHYPD